MPCGHIHFCAYFDALADAQRHADALNSALGDAYHRPPIQHKPHPGEATPEDSAPA